jgi:hypothetical protein
VWKTLALCKWYQQLRQPRLVFRLSSSRCSVALWLCGSDGRLIVWPSVLGASRRNCFAHGCLPYIAIGIAQERRAASLPSGWKICHRCSVSSRQSRETLTRRLCCTKRAAACS